MDSYFMEKKFRQDLQDKHDFFCSDHFPEESDPTQSAFSGKKPTINDIRHQPKVIGHDLGTLKIPISPKVTFAPRAHWVRLFSSPPASPERLAMAGRRKTV
jgi:hypothetical protein